jgi:hypothetical protein
VRGQEEFERRNRRSRSGRGRAVSIGPRVRGAFLSALDEHDAAYWRAAVRHMRRMGMDVAIIQTEAYLEPAAGAWTLDAVGHPLVETRTITSPRFGARGTGKWGELAFTGLVADDRGGGQVVIPGPNGSSFANQDQRSFVAIGRLRRDFGQSFVSLLLSDREREGGSWNRVLGPDFQWRPNSKDIVAGQLLWSDTRTPNNPDLAEE